MAFNLFLDDIRFPYLNPMSYSGQEKSDIYTTSSAYHYTGYSPLKDEQWVIIRNYDEFVEEILRFGIPNRISFDHDLGTEHYEKNTVIPYDDYKEKTGYDCAKWLCDYCYDNNIKFPEYYIHSMNVVGSNNIKSYIENYKKHCE